MHATDMKACARHGLAPTSDSDGLKASCSEQHKKGRTIVHSKTQSVFQQRGSDQDDH